MDSGICSSCWGLYIELLGLNYIGIRETTYQRQPTIRSMESTMTLGLVPPRHQHPYLHPQCQLSPGVLARVKSLPIPNPNSQNLHHSDRSLSPLDCLALAKEHAHEVSHMRLLPILLFPSCLKSWNRKRRMKRNRAGERGQRIRRRDWVLGGQGQQVAQGPDRSLELRQVELRQEGSLFRSMGSRSYLG